MKVRLLEAQAEWLVSDASTEGGGGRRVGQGKSVGDAGCASALASRKGEGRSCKKTGRGALTEPLEGGADDDSSGRETHLLMIVRDADDWSTLAAPPLLPLKHTKAARGCWLRVLKLMRGRDGQLGAE